MLLKRRMNQQSSPQTPPKNQCLIGSWVRVSAAPSFHVFHVIFVVAHHEAPNQDTAVSPLTTTSWSNFSAVTLVLQESHGDRLLVLRIPHVHKKWEDFAVVMSKDERCLNENIYVRFSCWYVFGTLAQSFLWSTNKTKEIRLAKAIKFNWCMVLSAERRMLSCSLPPKQHHSPSPFLRKLFCSTIYVQDLQKKTRALIMKPMLLKNDMFEGFCFWN